VQRRKIQFERKKASEVIAILLRCITDNGHARRNHKAAAAVKCCFMSLCHMHLHGKYEGHIDSRN
jgi:hypothetical protein